MAALFENRVAANAVGCQRQLKIPHFAGRKFPIPWRVVVDGFGCTPDNETQPVKRRRALVATNPLRNSRPDSSE